MSLHGGDDGGGDGAGSGGRGMGEVTQQLQPHELCLVAQRLSRDMAAMRRAMLVMNGKVGKAHDVVRLLALGLRLHRQRVQRLQGKMRKVERVLAKGDASDAAKDDGDDEDSVAEAAVQVSFPQSASLSRIRCSRSTDPGGWGTRNDSAEQAVCRPRRSAARALSTSSAISSSSRSRRWGRERESEGRGESPPRVPSRAVFSTAKLLGAGPSSGAALGRRLLRAVEDGCVEDVLELLDLGADPNFSAVGRWVPLHRAARKANADIVSMLLLWGANVHARTSYGFTALHIAAYNDPSAHCVAALVQAESDLDSRNKSGRTPLHSAAECGNEAAVRVLLAAGADTAARDDCGKTPYEMAKNNVVRRLLDRYEGDPKTLRPATSWRNIGEVDGPGSRTQRIQSTTKTLRAESPQ